ncbi:MAG: HAD family hydrolase [Anaerolineales bacterium]
MATKTVDGRPDAYSHTDENALTFAGFLLFFDPPKVDVQQVIVDLANRGVQLKIITGDNQKVARHVAEAVNLPLQGVLTGSELNDLHDEALWHPAERTTLFAEVDPNQKERIILALQKTRHVVGYMGDGINDLVSSIFDFLTFGTLLFLFRASPEEFRTGWFIESLITELVIALVVRTRHLFFRSRPGTLLLASTLIFIGIVLILPYLPFISVFGFVPLPAPFMLTMLGLTALYVLATELTKKYFYSRGENAIA